MAKYVCFLALSVLIDFNYSLPSPLYPSAVSLSVRLSVCLLYLPVAARPFHRL